MKKTITIVLLSVAVLGAAGWMVWQQQTIKAAEEKHQQERKTNDEQLSNLKLDQADMKHENVVQKKKLSTITKKLKKEKKAYQKELTAVKATAQANKQTAQAARKPTVKKDPNVTHHPPSQWVQDQYDWGVKQGYMKE
ncbi:hypothetical protein OWO30_06595 [Bacillus safensis]|uniref:hypothetical protein n=1 Tax=Bacillus safensis TaxID=561879 RepID=UPI002270B329|nr:hypothetical protein [Bacillus safensis]MCY1118002.1 hypothetical protein [Bacillus safensis]